MRRIYIQNKPLILAEKKDEEIEGYLNRPNTVFKSELNHENVHEMLAEMEKVEVEAGVFLHADSAALMDAFVSKLTLVKAAGGLIYSPDRELLLIFRRGKWDLPKGKLDEGEELEACAVREVKEETGISDAVIVEPIQISYHTYYEKGKHILKESHWYLMRTEGRSPLTPQTEEDIEQCLWVPINNLSAYIENMHASIVEVINEGVNLLTGKD